MIVAAFYALQDTKTPVKVAMVAVAVNLILSFYLGFMTPLKHGGLALALSLASTLQFCLLVFFLKRKIHLGELKPVFQSGLKCVFAASVMGLGVYYCHSRWFVAESGAGLWRLSSDLAGLLLIGIFLYFGAAKILRCSELESLKDIFLPLIKKEPIKEKRESHLDSE